MRCMHVLSVGWVLLAMAFVVESELGHKAQAQEGAWGKEPVAESEKAEPVKKKKHKKKLIATSVRENEPSTPSEQSKVVDSGSVFTRTWRGLRTKLAEQGIQIDAVYKGGGLPKF